MSKELFISSTDLAVNIQEECQITEDVIKRRMQLKRHLHLDSCKFPSDISTVEPS